MMSVFRIPIFINILVAYLVIASAYVILTPDWQAPDEPAHYNYVRYLATRSGFPELVSGCYDQTYLAELTARRFPPELSVDGLCYEFHQPPLYYLLATPLFVVSDGSLLALRLLSVGLGAGVVILAFFIGQTIFPDRPTIALGTMAFVAFVPMHLAMLASVNNDALAELILAGLLLLLIRRLLVIDQPSTRNDVWLGGLLGLGLITKMTVYIAIPLVAVALWLALPAEPGPPGRLAAWRGLAQRVAPIYSLALTIGLPWYIRNATVYGRFDILGLARHDEIVVGQLRTADKLAQVGWIAYLRDFVTTTFHSFWGQFGWMAVPMDGRTYLFLTLLSLIVAGGLVGLVARQGRWAAFGSRFSQDTASPQRLSPGQGRALALMGLAILLVALAYIWYNLTFVQLQGRYLFPALIPLGLFFSLGLREAFSQRWVWWLAAGLAVALAWVIAASLLEQALDKRVIVIMGLALGLAVGRALLARRWFVPPAWLMAACFAGLGLLALLSPFWFVLPNLS